MNYIDDDIIGGDIIQGFAVCGFCDSNAFREFVDSFIYDVEILSVFIGAPVD